MKEDDFHISFSRMSYFKSCPRKYYLRYVEKVPQPVGVGMLAGSAIHRATAEEYRNIMKGAASSTDTVVDYAVNEFNGLVATNREQGLLDMNEDVVGEKDAVARSQRHYHQEAMLKNKNVVIAVEKELTFSFKSDGLKVLGYIDRVEKDDEGLVIGELKTSARKATQFNYSAQVALYAVPEKIRRGLIEVLVKTKTPQILRVPIILTDEDYNDVLGQIRQVTDSIKELLSKSKVFWWKNEGFGCGMCWYREHCHGGRSDEGSACAPSVEKA